MKCLSTRGLSLALQAVAEYGAPTASHVKWGHLRLAPSAIDARFCVRFVSLVSVFAVILGGANGTKWS